MTEGFGGLHISLDDIVFSVAHKNALVDHWRQCPARVNNLYVTQNRLGETIPLARSFVEQFPDTRWILRLHPDDGNHRKPEYVDPDNLYARNRPFHAMGFTVLIDNESNFSTQVEFATYRDWTSKYLEMAGRDRHAAAWGRTSAGTPKEEFYEFYNTTLAINARYGDLHTYSPNEYEDHKDGGAGSINRYKLTWAVADSLGIRRPVTSIGEFGLARDYDPQKGFRGIGMSEWDYVLHLGDVYARWYRAAGVSVSLYMFPENVKPWEEMGLSIGALAAIRHVIKNNPDPVAVVQPPANPTPKADDARWELGWKAYSNGTYTVYVRKTPVDGVDLGSIVVGGFTVGHIPFAKLTAAEQKFATPGGQEWLLIKLPTGEVGWSRASLVRMEAPVDDKGTTEVPPDYITRDEFEAFKGNFMAYLNAQLAAQPTATINEIQARLSVPTIKES